MRGTTRSDLINGVTSWISIHVPREGDDGMDAYVLNNTFISIHVPREGDDQGLGATA